MGRELAILIAAIVVFSGATVYQKPEAKTVYKTTTYTTLYTSTYTTVRTDPVQTIYSTTILHTLTGDLAKTFKDQPINVTRERASNYPISALVFDILIPPGTPRGFGAELVVTLNYESSAEMTLEELSVDGWSYIKTASEMVLTYHPLVTIKVHEGTGSWKSWVTYIPEGQTTTQLVFASKGGFPDILSVDIDQVTKNAPTRTSTYIGPYTDIVKAPITYTLMKTYVTTEVTSIPTEEPPPVYLGILIAFVFVIALVALVILTIRRRKPRRPHTWPPRPTTLTPPI